MNLNEIETGPPRKFRAIESNGLKREVFFTLDEILAFGNSLFQHAKGGWINLAQCHIDQFTGHHDKDGKEVYGGDVLQGLITAIVYWSKYTGEWFVVNPRDPKSLAEFCDAQAFRNIGNIHNPAELSEEVRRMIDET